MMPDMLCGASSSHFFFSADVFMHFKSSLHLPQLFQRMLQHCFYLRLQKCFADYENSPDFLSTMTQFAFWVNLSFNVHCIRNGHLSESYSQEKGAAYHQRNH